MSNNKRKEGWGQIEVGIEDMVSNALLYLGYGSIELSMLSKGVICLVMS